MTHYEHERVLARASGKIFSKTMTYENLLYAEQVLLRAMQNPKTPTVVQDIYTHALVQLRRQIEQKANH